MFFFKRKNQEMIKKARSIFMAQAEKMRDPLFYTDFKIPDSFQGRLEVLFLLVGAEIVKVEKTDPPLAQQIFDETFKYLEISLREQGVGDMGVPKRIKKMMKALHGRARAYQLSATKGDEAELINALWRNIYAEVEITQDDAGLKKLADFVARLYVN